MMRQFARDGGVA